MKRFASVVVALSALALLVDVAWAQPESGGPGPDRPFQPDRVGQPDRSGQGPPGGRNRGRRGDEGRRPPPPLVAALDADRDGTLSAAEIENAVAALKKLDRNGDGKLTPDELRPRGGPPRQGGGGPGAGGRGNFVERMLQNDKDKDGKLSKEEMPERMQQNFDRIDSNKDGSVDRSELEAMMQRFRERRGGRPGGNSGDRPQRPQRPQLEQ